MQAIHLVSAGTYAEKTVGYLAASILLNNTDEQITLIVQSIRNDLQSPQDTYQCLALSAIANIGGVQLAEALAPDVQRWVLAGWRARTPPHCLEPAAAFARGLQGTPHPAARSPATPFPRAPPPHTPCLHPG